MAFWKIKKIGIKATNSIFYYNNYTFINYSATIIYLIKFFVESIVSLRMTQILKSLKIFIPLRQLSK